MVTKLIRLDEGTILRLKTLAKHEKNTVAGFLRDLSSGMVAGKSEIVMADLILEIRAMGHALEMSEKRMKVLDLFLAKAAPATLEVIKEDLSGRLDGKAPAVWDEALSDIINTIISGMNEVQLEALKVKLNKGDVSLGE